MEKNTTEYLDRKKKKKTIFYLLLSILFTAGTFLSPVISPYLISWINFNLPIWETLSIVFGVIIFLSFFGLIIWLAIDSVKRLLKTIKMIFKR